MLRKARITGSKSYCSPTCSSITKGSPVTWPQDQSHFLKIAINTEDKSYNLSPSLFFFPSYILIKRRKEAEGRRKNSRRAGGVRGEKSLVHKLFLFKNLLSSSLDLRSIFNNP